MVGSRTHPLPDLWCLQLPTSLPYRPGPVNTVNEVLFSYVPKVCSLELPQRHVLASFRGSRVANSYRDSSQWSMEFSADALPPVLDILMKRQSNAKSNAHLLTPNLDKNGQGWLSPRQGKSRLAFARCGHTADVLSLGEREL